jgi:predicted small lipoprotein YifL
MKVRFASCACLAAILPGLTACSLSGPNALSFNGNQTYETSAAQDSVKRNTPVVPGRRARVFIMAGLGTNCEPLAPPAITITQLPDKGSVSLEPGQETTIQTSVSGTCIGHKATGTGIYYTARAGETGPDKFSIVANLSSGEVATRTFEVTITE